MCVLCFFRPTGDDTPASALDALNSVSRFSGVPLHHLMADLHCTISWQLVDPLSSRVLEL